MKKLTEEIKITFNPLFMDLFSEWIASVSKERGYLITYQAFIREIIQKEFGFKEVEIQRRRNPGLNYFEKKKNHILLRIPKEWKYKIRDRSRELSKERGIEIPVSKMIETTVLIKFEEEFGIKISNYFDKKVRRNSKIKFKIIPRHGEEKIEKLTVDDLKEEPLDPEKVSDDKWIPVYGKFPPKNRIRKKIKIDE